METKFRGQAARPGPKPEAKRPLPEPEGGLPDQELADLIKHAGRKIDAIFGDAIQLVERPYDTFKIGAGLTALVLRRFEGLLRDVAGDDAIDDMTGSQRLHALADLMIAMQAFPTDELTEHQKILRSLLGILIESRFRGNKSAGKVLEAAHRALRRAAE